MPQTTEKPKYRQRCPDCIFLGGYDFEGTRYDLYLHNIPDRDEQGQKQPFKLIARSKHSNKRDDENYWFHENTMPGWPDHASLYSDDAKFDPLPPLGMAYKLAVEKGLIKKEVTV
ncbi:MAG TPA: hypothetical protein VGE45_00955 [Chloroflexia bacterium]|jgi:hypothetical protein